MPTILSGYNGQMQAYEGTQGTSVVKVFDLTAAATGLNERTLKMKGKEEGKDYETIIISQKSHAVIIQARHP